MSVNKISKSQRTRYWTSLEVLRLVDLWRIYHNQIESFDKNGPAYRHISAGMREYRSHVNAQECRRKMRSLRTRYFAERKKLETDGDDDKSDWPIFWFIHTIYAPREPNVDVLNSKKRIDSVFDRMKAAHPQIPKRDPAQLYRFIKSNHRSRCLRFIEPDMLSGRDLTVLGDLREEDAKQDKPKRQRIRRPAIKRQLPDYVDMRVKSPKSVSSTYSESSSDQSALKRIKLCDMQPPKDAVIRLEVKDECISAEKLANSKSFNIRSQASTKAPPAVLVEESWQFRGSSLKFQMLPRSGHITNAMIQKVRNQNNRMAEQLRLETTKLRQEQQYIEILEEIPKDWNKELDIILPQIL